MAQTSDAMTPQDALSTIANLRGYRETLTRRAAGIVWIVWGFALALVSFQVLFHEFPAAMDGPASQAKAGAAFEIVTNIAVLCIAALLTNIVWKAHALETDRTHPAWVPYVAGVGVVVLIGNLNFAANWLFTRYQTGGPSDGIAFAPLALLSAAGALTIAILQRHRVPMLPGIIAALLLFNVFVFARWLDFSQGHDTQFWGAGVIAWLPLLAYTAVGLVTMRKA